MTRVPLILVGFVLLFSAGCMAIDFERPARCIGETWQESTLYLGRTMNGVSISDEAWMKFVESDVTSRFPQGFTFLGGHGAWRSAQLGKTSYENSTLLVILHPDTEQELSKIREVANAYRVTFNQEAVLVAHEKACVDFIVE